ncbi:MAG TPA: outer membrane protein assembly factor BamD [Terriglobales bacterium]|nr:outer membrane protein assembly factor BamD [Terriglobales bacterium]
MFRRYVIALLLASCLLVVVGCRNKNVKNPLANVNSKQPDKVLFDRAMDAMQHRKYDVARLSLQTLINTYPDSEFIARAKLAIGDSWYAEGGSAAMAQAENEYRDFITFFPNMPEAAEAQMKIGDIHFKQIEKPDRDYTHAKRAEDEYRQMLLQYPDSKLADKARARLLEVQEILAEREYRIGRFYYLRQSYPAAIARLKTMTDTYPLYSGADEALFMLGQSYEKELDRIRTIPTNAAFTEQRKARLVKLYTEGANEAYSRIITQYPIMARAGDAKERLKALDLAVPTPTQEAIEQNKKIEASRGELGRMGRIMLTFHKSPDFKPAASVGNPVLVDPKETSAPELIKEANSIVMGVPTGGDNKVSIESTGANGGKVPENQPVPRSDSGNATDKTDVPKDAPAQVNEAGNASSNSGDGNATKSDTDNTKQADSAKTGDAKNADKKDDKQVSSSKPKKKKGLRKIIPF